MSESAGNNFKKVTHVIFDMDGLLLDTEKLYTQAMQMVIGQFGKTFTWEVKAQLMGRQHREVAELMVEIYQLPISWDEFSKQQTRITEEIMINAKMMPDTETVYEVIENQIANMYGKSLTHEARLKILGTTEQRSAEIAISMLNLPTTVEEYLRHFHQLCEEMMQNTRLMKGAERLMRHLHTHNIPIALATSSGEPMVEIKITNHRELFKLFHHRVCGSTDPEVTHGKPAPDIFLIAAARFADKPDPSQCLVFEDAPNGVTAALAAGMQVVMVPDEHIVKGLKLEATQVLKSLEDFKPEQFGLPAFT